MKRNEANNNWLPQNRRSKKYKKINFLIFVLAQKKPHLYLLYKYFSDASVDLKSCKANTYNIIDIET